MPKETYMETAKEVLAEAFNLRKAHAKYSVTFMVIQIFCKGLEDGNGSTSKCYIEQFYDSC
jgi:hypothetical protein